ncbi:beta-galactosidase [Paenibacillus sp. LHD-117]|uniref:beta-galactosidase n=1 Tax=Paenibacillus sp. LHD-117 TaxID=3071412 RepID=UPI0027DEF980|nr:beta-galactosidase [Paenibacillus sp. LHD-117]MDQ6423603.1 beta-galactosidase [Paenibacillus sp. LHD-117]
MVENMTNEAVIINGPFFHIQGQRKLILSGETQYYKNDPLEWEERITKSKAALLNCVSTYVVWGLHEKKKGTFDFEGNLDIVKFEELIRRHHLYSILKPSGYVCNEVSGGGFPGWIWSEKVRTRTTDPLYMEYLNRWLDTVTPLLNNCQITHGGSAILWQVENEFGCGNKPYLMALADKVRQLGIQVPIVFNNHVYYPEEGILGAFDYYLAPSPESLRSVVPHMHDHRLANPGKPMYSQEFEAGWFNTAFSTDVTIMGYLPRVWLESLSKLTFLHGCAGVNYFMFSGGTDPGMQPAKLFPNRYFNEAPIEEWGEIGELFYRYKNTHAQYLSFEQILLQDPVIWSDEETAAVLEGVPSSIITVIRGREDLADGVLIGFSNASEQTCSFTWRSPSLQISDAFVTLQPLETRMYPIHIQAGEGLKLIHSTAETLYRDTKLWVVFDDEGIENRMVFSMDGAPQTFSFTHSATDQVFQARDLRILVISRERALRTWFGPEREKSRDILVSDLYYADMSSMDELGRIRVEAENGKRHSLTWIRGEDASVRQSEYVAPDTSESVLSVIPITDWDICSDWEGQALGRPQPDRSARFGVPFERMGHVECGYGVYDGVFHSSEENRTLLIPEVNDFFDLYINGEYVVSGRRSMQMELSNVKIGLNRLTLRCFSTGMDKDMAMDPALSGMMLPFYTGLLHSEEMVRWEQKMLFDAEGKDRFFAHQDQLLSFHDDGFAKQIGLDMHRISGESEGWSAFHIESSGVKLSDGNVDFSGSGEVLNRAVFYADSSLAGSKVLLEIRDADLIYSLYVNGERVAAIWQGWSVWGYENRPKYFDITPLVRFNESNEVMLRCTIGPRKGGVRQPASVSYYKEAIDGDAAFTPLEKGIHDAVCGKIGTWRKSSLQFLETGDRMLRIVKSKFNYRDDAALVRPLYLELNHVHDFTLIYVNGMMIGKYYPGGYQNRFYLWRSWLREGDNEVYLVGQFANSGEAAVMVGSYHTKVIDQLECL